MPRPRTPAADFNINATVNQLIAVTSSRFGANTDPSHAHRRPEERRFTLTDGLAGDAFRIYESGLDEIIAVLMRYRAQMADPEPETVDAPTE